MQGKNGCAQLNEALGVPLGQMQWKNPRDYDLVEVLVLIGWMVTTLDPVFGREVLPAPTQQHVRTC